VNAYWFDTPMAVFEIATALWLAFKGLRTSRVTGPAKASA
jgi:hypothetical protein